MKETKTIELLDEMIENFESEENSDSNYEMSSLIKYEEVFSRIFKELGLNSGQCQLIRALILESKGEVVFETSFRNIARKIYREDSEKFISKIGSIRYAFQTLEKWQSENKIEIVRVLEKGHRERTPDGKFKFNPSKYEFVLLDELVRVYFNNPANLEIAVADILANIKAQYRFTPEKKKYHPNHLIRKAKNTIRTKFYRIFELAVEAGSNPIQHCQMLLDEICNTLSQLNEDFKEQQKRKEFIAKFEKSLNTNRLANKSKELNTN
jgi:hypothetical protein